MVWGESGGGGEWQIVVRFEQAWKWESPSQDSPSPDGLDPSTL